jgi:hypothetical protein
MSNNNYFNIRPRDGVPVLATFAGLMQIRVLGARGGILKNGK